MKLSVREVSKQYRRCFWELRDFSPEIGAGALGLLRRNGANRSTLKGVLATIKDRTIGAVTCNGLNNAKHSDNPRQVLGYLPQDFGVYPNLSALEFLAYMSAVKRLDRASPMPVCVASYRIQAGSG